MEKEISHNSGKQIPLPHGKFLSSDGNNPSKALQTFTELNKKGIRGVCRSKNTILETTVGQKMTAGFT